MLSHLFMYLLFYSPSLSSPRCITLHNPHCVFGSGDLVLHKKSFHLNGLNVWIRMPRTILTQDAHSTCCKTYHSSDHTVNANPSPLYYRIMRPDDANIMGNVHGGTILKMIEEAGCIIGTRHCNTQNGVRHESQVFCFFFHIIIRAEKLLELLLT